MDNKEQDVAAPSVPLQVSPSGKVIKQPRQTFESGGDATDEIQNIVHRDQTEGKCRMLEGHLGNAVKVLTENPNGFYKITVSPGMTFNTLANRLMSARAGFDKYKYPSQVIPADFDLKRLRISEVPNGVLVTLWPEKVRLW
jgi:hypothetical protein